MRNVLVISSSEWPVAELRAALGDDICGRAALAGDRGICRRLRFAARR
jgi:hypothetical protein